MQSTILQGYKMNSFKDILSQLDASKQKKIGAPIIIAEIGCNHRGDLLTAIEMIKVASQFCKADVVKFQKRTNIELLTEEEYRRPHPNPHNSYGATYGEHREFLEFNLEQHKLLQQACEYWGIQYSTSVWDITSAKEIVSISPSLIKVPSAINTDLLVMNYLFTNYPGEIHISLGMTTRKEEEVVVEMGRKYNRLKDIVLYHCISGYPVEESELCLKEISRINNDYASEIKAVGFSGHHRGIAADIAALAFGATYFERHFTLDRTWKGTDHAASLEPDGLRRLTRDIKDVNEALKEKKEDILLIEVEQRNKLKRKQKINDFIFT